MHVFNLFLLAIAVSLILIFLVERNSADTEEDSLQSTYYMFLSDLGFSIVDIYVDLFLLWLLSKFMKPKKILDDGRSETVAILFVFDA